MAKRSATTDLNHDNWNEESKPEEAGTFAKAPDDVLEKRVVKTAKRRLPPRDGSSKNVFGAFTGFKTASATNSSPFSFLANAKTSGASISSAPSTNGDKVITSNGASKNHENGRNKTDDSLKVQSSSLVAPKKSTTEQEKDEKSPKKSSEYFAKLKGLNESVTQWIKTHVDENPFCILTPIFRDYEKYLKEIEAKHGAEATKPAQAQQEDQATSSKEGNENPSTEKPQESSSGTASTKSPVMPTEWKPEKSIFGNISSNTKSIFGKVEQKADGPKSIFGGTDQSSDSQKSIFGNLDTSSRSVFGNVSSEKNPFLSKPASSEKPNEEESKTETKPTSVSFPSWHTSTSTFSFGQSSSSSTASAGFSFGSAKPFSFGTQAVKQPEPDDKTDNEANDDDEEPPKPEFKPVTEEGAFYEQRCKVFVKKDSTFSDRGIGMLFLKSTPSGKTQLIIRAETSLGTLLLNTLLTEGIPIKRMNNNTIMLVCLPLPDSQPPPTPVLLRVKTSEIADTLLETLNKHKK